MSKPAIHETMSELSATQRTARFLVSATPTIDAVGRYAVRYGLVVVLVWIGGMKFTAYEAEGISDFVSNSPLMSWAYSLFSVQGFSTLLGVTEIVIALLVAARPLSAGIALAGSSAAAGMFLTTLSFLLTTPGVWETSAGGFPALSVVPGQFLIKDFVLLGASLRLFADDWQSVATDRRGRSERCDDNPPVAATLRHQCSVALRLSRRSRASRHR